MAGPGLTASQRAELRALLPAGGLAEDGPSCEAHRGDEAVRSDDPPAAVAFPRTTAEVSRVLAWAWREGVPVTPRGAGTGKAGGCAPLAGGIVLSLARMDALREVREGAALAVVEPGVVTGVFHEAVEARGLFYPPDPASLSTCTLGGNVATNAGGPRAVKYGVTREYVLGLEAVLPDGRVIRTGHRTLKGVSGYDLTALLVGSEGTLAVLTSLVLRLRARPRSTVTAAVPFADLGAAASAVPALLSAGCQPRTLEVLDRHSLAAARRSLRVDVPDGAGALLLVEVDGEPEGCRAEMDRLLVALPPSAGVPRVAGDEAEREALWAARREMSVLVKHGAAGWTSEDVTVPPDRMGELCAFLDEVSAGAGIRVAVYGHAGDGNLHVNLLWDDPSGRPRAEEAARAVFRRALDLEGTLTGEHGIGSARTAFMPWEHGSAELDLMRALKRAWDPKGILNPGKVLG